MATDEQLIRQIQEGNSEEFGELFRKYYGQIYKFDKGSVEICSLRSPTTSSYGISTLKIKGGVSDDKVISTSYHNHTTTLHHNGN